ncbi:MAG: DUF488 domain-containing protein [Proteobacteria bacterium]|nr:MAG: DUF488 domain-containing protein [Pseudomonadota bacterium]
MGKPDIVIKRIYEDAANRDGHRVLVDRLWPRGVSKDVAKLDDWCKDLAPSDDLRKWFDHDPDKFEEFAQKYKKELQGCEAKLDELLDIAKNKRVTLLYGAKDEQHNQAVVLRQVLCGHD